MRVLVVAEVDPARTGSGAERVLDEHARALHRRGHAVTILSGGARAATRDGAVTVEPVGWSLATPWRVRRAVARLPAPPDAVVLHHPYPGLLLLGARALGGAPVTLVYHSPWHEEMRARRADASGSAIRRGIERTVVRRVRRVYPLSRFMAGRLDAIHGVAGERVRIVPGGVDRTRFAPPADRGAVRASLGLPATACVLLTVRNLEPRMGLVELLRAMPAIRTARPDARLVVAGAGALAAPLRAQARTLGLLESVTFPGFVPEADLSALYGAADLSVVPSQSLEGFGLVTLESLACGTPVVGTPVGATPELLAPLDPALVLDGASPDAIGRGILRVLARDDAPALRARCRAHTKAYTWDAAVAALEADLAELARR
jgi:glycosyltransferase involved in cell wall biosynthesis